MYALQMQWLLKKKTKKVPEFRCSPSYLHVILTYCNDHKSKRMICFLCKNHIHIHVVTSLTVGKHLNSTESIMLCS